RGGEIRRPLPAAVAHRPSPAARHADGIAEAQALDPVRPVVGPGRFQPHAAHVLRIRLRLRNEARDRAAGGAERAELEQAAAAGLFLRAAKDYVVVGESAQWGALRCRE